MIEIRLGPRGVEAKGHAGYRPYGQDIVCAGVSALLATAAEMLLRLEAAGKVRLPEPVQLEPGDVRLTWEALGDGTKADMLWETLETGLRLMEARYGQYVVITSGEPDE